MTSRAETEERKLAVFSACSSHTGVVAAARSVGVTENTVNWWKDSDPDWYARCKETCARTRAIERSKRQAPKTPRKWDTPPEQMDFLAFRERFFKRKNFWFHSDAYGQIEANNRLIMLVPPNHAKTTVWSIEYTTYKLMTQPDIRIAIIQKSQVEAKKIIAAVKDRLTNHEFYQNLGIPIDEDPITLYGGPGGFKPEREDGLSWSAEAFYVRQRSLAEKDPSLQAKGVTSGLLGNRIDLVIVDDIQDDKNYTPQGLDGLKQWWTHTLMSRLDGNDKISKAVLLGSRIGPGDFYEYLEDEYALMPGGEYPESERIHRWPIKKYAAILNEETKELLCPDIWSWEALMRKKFEVKDKWWSNWMQVEGQDDGATFVREKLLGARDREHILGQVPQQVTDVFVGVDPAIRNYCAIVAWGLDRKTGYRYLVDVENRKGMGNWDNVTALASELADRYRARSVVVETNNTQGDVYWRIEQACRKIGVRCTSYATATATGAKAEETEFSISSIGALFDADMVVLPYGDADTAKRVDAYIDQLCNWRPRPSGTSSWHLTRDMVMATLFAESQAREVMRRSRPKGGAKRRPMPGFVPQRWDKRSA